MEEDYEEVSYAQELRMKREACRRLREIDPAFKSHKAGEIKICELVKKHFIVPFAVQDPMKTIHSFLANEYVRRATKEPPMSIPAAPRIYSNMNRRPYKPDTLTMHAQTRAAGVQPAFKAISTNVTTHFGWERREAMSQQEDSTEV